MLRGGDDDQSALAVRLLQVLNHGDFLFTVTAPVGPEEEQNRVAAMLGERLCALPGDGTGQFQGGRGLAFQCEEVQIFTNAGTD